MSSPSLDRPEPAKVQETVQQVRFWCQVSRQVPDPDGELRVVPQWLEDAELEDEAFQASPHLQAPQKPPLLPWSRLWPFLKKSLGHARQGHRPHLKRAIARICRGQLLDQIPMQSRHTWAPQAQVLIDLSPRMEFFLDDYRDLIDRVRPLRGRDGFKIQYIEEGPNGAYREWFASWRRSPEFEIPAAGTPLLVLGDCGCLADSHEVREAWLKLGQRLCRAGVKATVLAPCAPHLWDVRLSAYWRVVFWDRGSKPGAGRSPGSAVREHALQDLLALCSVAVRVEPALLRAIRYLLPQWAHVGLESEMRQHPHLECSLSAFAYRPQHIEAYRHAFSQQPEALQQAVFELIDLYHQGLSPGIAAEEALVAQSLLGRDERSAFMAGVARRLKQGGKRAAELPPRNIRNSPCSGPCGFLAVPFE